MFSRSTIISTKHYHLISIGIFLFISVLFNILLLPGISYGQSKFTKPKIYAVIVGVSQYQDKNIPELKFPEKDAQEFYEFVRSARSGSVPEENIALLTGNKATRGAIIKEVVEKFSRADKGDMLIFYFSGHGIGSALDRSGYLLSYDTEFDNEAATAVSMDEINIKINRFDAKMKVSYVDACHAGMLSQSNTKGLAEDNQAIADAFTQNLKQAGQGNVAFLASQPRQQSLESEKLGHGVFTHYLLKGLNGAADQEHKGTADFNDGKVTISELNTYLSNSIPLETKYKQKPLIDGEYDDDFPLSVLKPGVAIYNEIASRPVKVKQIAATPTAVAEPAAATSAKAAKVKMSDGMTMSSNSCYGMYTITNNLKFPVVLYYARAYFGVKMSLIIAPGESAETPRLLLGGGEHYQASSCEGKTIDCKFYFKTTNEVAPTYALYQGVLESGWNKSLVLTSNNTYFTKQEPR